MVKGKGPVLREDSAEFVHNHELQTEQLKYAVRKEVEEANLLAEAKKSLLRSFKAETAERERAQGQIQKLREQLQQVQQRAKLLQESIRDEKQKQRAISGEAAHTDSDEEAELLELLDEGGDEGYAALIDDYDELMSELITRSSATAAKPNRRLTVNISAEQRLRILRLAEEDKTQKAKQEATKRHKAMARKWNVFEDSRRRKKGSAVVAQEFDESAALQLRDSLLHEGLAAEQELLASLSAVMQHYMAPLLQERLITSSEAHDVFANLGSLVPSQKALLVLLEGVLQGSSSLGDLAHFFISRGEVFREYVETRDQCRESLVHLIRRNEAVAKWFTDPFSTTSSAKIQQLLDKPVQYIIHYPAWLDGLLQCCPEFSEDFDALAAALATLNAVVRECGQEEKAVVSSNPHAQLIEIDMRFRWSHKGRVLGSFKSDRNRAILMQFRCREWLTEEQRLKRQPTEFLAIMMTDALVLARPACSLSSELLFHTFVPAESLVVWDLPPLVSEPAARLEVVNMKSGFQMRLQVDDEQKKKDFMRIAASAQLTLDMSLDAMLAELR